MRKLDYAMNTLMQKPQYRQLHGLEHKLINKKSQAYITRTLSSLYLIDKVIIVFKAMLAKHAIHDLLLQLHERDNHLGNLQELRTILESADGVLINGLIYQLKPAGKTGAFWFIISKTINPTLAIKEELIEKKQYDMAQEGKPYHLNSHNFIQDRCLVVPANVLKYKEPGHVPRRSYFMNDKLLADQIKVLPQKVVKRVVETVIEISVAIRTLHLKYYSSKYEYFEINLALNTSSPNKDLEKLKRIAFYLFGKPVLKGKKRGSFVEYRINAFNNLKIYRKVKPNVKLGILGMVRLELVLRQVSMRGDRDWYSIIVRAQNDLEAMAKYMFDSLDNSQPRNLETTKAFDDHLELTERSICNKKVIPAHLLKYFTEIAGSSIRAPYALKPEVLTHFIKE